MGTTITVNIQGPEMDTLPGKEAKTSQEGGVFIVRFKDHDADIKAMVEMGRIGSVHSKKNEDNVINKKQLKKLQRLKIPFELVKPSSLGKSLRE